MSQCFIWDGVQAIVCNFCLTGNISIFKLFFLFIKTVLAISFPLLEAIYLQKMQYKLAAAEAAVYNKCPPLKVSLPNSWCTVVVFNLTCLFDNYKLRLLWLQINNWDICSSFTCPVEPSHVHHGFMVGQLYIFLGYYQLDLVPLLRLRDKHIYTANSIRVYTKRQRQNYSRASRWTYNI